ncbi:MAG: hypothetical protein SV186_05025 [Candidatus Nanohaloarchaea archaeon]|nr:hypothetical protein [Candidatus Nanohaloarchaea archaeon]
MTVQDKLQYANIDPYIQDKVNQARKILDERDIDLDERDVLVGFDMNGPLTDRDSSELLPNDQVTAAIRTLPLDDDSVLTAMISGYDLGTLDHFRSNRLELEERMELVGELGSIYQLGDDVRQVHPSEDPDDLIELKQQLYEQAAQEDRKLLEQGNFSSVVGCTRVEGEGRPGDPRGETYQHFDAHPEATTKDLWDELRDVDGFDYDEQHDRIIYESTQETTETLSQVLRHDYTFVGVRFHETGDGRVALERDRSDADIDMDDAHGFVRRALGDDWDHEHNPDWGTDYIKETADVSKERGANALAQDYFEGSEDDYVILHVGDKESDVMEGENALAFPQQGMPAEEYCRENDIPHVPVKNAWDYALVVSDLIYGDTA